MISALMINADNCILVTAADNRYSDSLFRMLQSLQQVQLPLAVLDLGLSNDMCDQIRSTYNAGCHILDPGWCISIEGRLSTPAYKKVFLAKPFLPELLPGYSKYLWIDADICFQDNSALNDYILASDINGAAIGFEDHPGYNKKPQSWLKCWGLGKKPYKARRMEQYFGRAAARKWSGGATLNSGIFCIRNDSELWPRWQAAMKMANLTGQERKRLICDQTCLDYAISRFHLPVEKMPATHNWCLGLGYPLCRDTVPYLVDPMPPHHPIKVLHATGSAAETSAFMNKYASILSPATRED